MRIQLDSGHCLSLSVSIQIHTTKDQKIKSVILNITAYYVLKKMSLALIPIVLSGDMALKGLQLLDSVAGVLLRLSGLGILAFGTSVSAASTLAGPNQDLIDLYRLDIVELFRQVACLLLDADRMCSHASRKPSADRTDLLRRLIGSSQDLHRQVPTGMGTAAPASDSPIECNDNSVVKVDVQQPYQYCLCQSHTFQEALYQLAQISEQAYAHIVAIEYRRQQHQQSWSQYIPGYSKPDHRVNIEALRKDVLPRMEKRIQKVLQSAAFAEVMLTSKSRRTI